MILRHLLEMIRFSHTIFALPFALLAAVMAWVAPTSDGLHVPFRWLHLVGIVICMVAARSAAMAFNRLADRKLDAENPRTRSRHLPAGVLSVSSVVTFTLVSAAVFVAGTLLFLPNVLPIVLSLPVLGFLLAYSYTKRFTSLSHFVLGASLGLAPLGAWVAVLGDRFLEAPAFPLLIGGAVLLWTAGFDVIYACQDASFDRRAGLHSLPSRIGVGPSLRVSTALHAGTLALLVAAGAAASLSVPFFCGVAAVAALLVYAHAVVSEDDLSRMNVAFFAVNGWVSVTLMAATLIDLWTR